jgi:GPH family glycoside/pentoside/hexuronide:cation symporter
LDEGFMSLQTQASHSLSFRAGLLALPLAFVALPMYVNLPHFYATQFAVPLASLGAVLLFSRLADALIDPVLGRFSDALYAKSTAHVVGVAMAYAAGLLLSFIALFFPPSFDEPFAYVMWVAVCVTVCHLTFSGLSILHQAWATRLGGGASQQSRVLAWREGAGLVGVVTASVLPVMAGWLPTTFFLGVMLFLGLFLWSLVFKQTRTLPAIDATLQQNDSAAKDNYLPLRQISFRKLLVVFLLNGIASAVPASLVMFFVEDQIQASANMSPLFLGAYFLAGTLSLPLWLKSVRMFGLPKTWLYGMALAIVSFAGVGFLGPGDEMAFLAVCIASGMALGADLVVPTALLNRVIDTLGHRGRAEGLYLGWWNLASKLNLALAAGICLPLLSYWGYTPGTQTPDGLSALSLAYGVLPCVLKLLALATLYVFWIQQPALEPATRSD